MVQISSDEDNQSQMDENSSGEENQPPMDQNSFEEIQPPTSFLVRTLTTIKDDVTNQVILYLGNLFFFLYIILYETVSLMADTTQSVLVGCIGLLFRERWATIYQAVRAGGTLLWNIFQGFLQSIKNYSLNPEEFHQGLLYP